MKIKTIFVSERENECLVGCSQKRSPFFVFIAILPIISPTPLRKISLIFIYLNKKRPSALWQINLKYQIENGCYYSILKKIYQALNAIFVQIFPPFCARIFWDNFTKIFLQKLSVRAIIALLKKYKEPEKCLKYARSFPAASTRPYPK